MHVSAQDMQALQNRDIGPEMGDVAARQAEARQRSKSGSGLGPALAAINLDTARTNGDGVIDAAEFDQLRAAANADNSMVRGDIGRYVETVDAQEADAFIAKNFAGMSEAGKVALREALMNPAVVEICQFPDRPR
jgi:hypothetical protein